MTTPFQPGHHPDADQLSAFAEHALPLHEQQATLAHLAACADCRDLVYLAQPPAPQLHSQPVHTRAHLFARWMLAFPAAAALACLIFLTVHFRDAAGNPIAVPRTAHIETPPPPPAAPPEPAAPPKAAPAHLSTPPAHRKPEPADVPSATEDKENRSRTFSAAGYSAATPPPAAPPAVPLKAAPSPQLPLIAGATAHRELRSAATQYDVTSAQARQAPKENYSEAAPGGAEGMKSEALPHPDVQDLALTGRDTTELLKALPAASKPAASPNVGLAPNLDQQPTSEGAAPLSQAQTPPTLPSDLPAVSVANSSHHLLAIDAAGTLFRSEDAGVTWEPVPIQWNGRAVSVALVPAPNDRLLRKSLGGLSAPPAAAKSAAPTTPDTFQLTTGAGDLWISNDGQTWKHK